MKIKISILFLLLLSNACFTQRNASAERKGAEADLVLQDSIFQHHYSIPIQGTYLIADNLQNLYVATDAGQVVKFNKKGEKQFDYNNNRLGKIGKIDVRNPLNILVYYPDLAIITILDRTLSPIKELNLFDLDIIEPKGVAIANDNTIWIFDEVTAVLKKINQAGNVIFASRNLNQRTQKNLRPSFLQEYNNHLYLSDPTHGVFIFDTFGQLHQSIPIKGIKRFQVIDNQVVFWKENQLFTLSLDSLKVAPLKIPLDAKNLQNFHMTNQLLYLIKKRSIEVYGSKKS